MITHPKTRISSSTSIFAYHNTREERKLPIGLIIGPTRRFWDAGGAHKIKSRHKIVGLLEQIRCFNLLETWYWPAGPRCYDSDEPFRSLYTNTMNELLDKLLPSRKTRTRVRPLAAWLGRECGQLRRLMRGLERLPKFQRACGSLYVDLSASGSSPTSSNEGGRILGKLGVSWWKDPRRLWSTIWGFLGRATRM